MTNVITLESLAKEIKISVNSLIKLFTDIGILKKKIDFITLKEKEKLFLYLNKKQNLSNKLILKRKKYSTLNILNNFGKNKSIKIEVRKSKIYLKKIQLTKKNKEKINIKNLQDINLKKDKKINNNSKNLNFNKEFNISKNKNKIIEQTNGNRLNKRNKDKIKLFKKDSLNIFKKNKNIWNSKLILDLDKNKDNYHTKTAKSARAVESEIDKKINNVNKFKNKINKNIKIKKDNLFKIKNIVNINNPIKNRLNNLTHNFIKPIKLINKNIIINKKIKISELSKKMSIKSSQIIDILKQLDILVDKNQFIDRDIAQLIAEESGYKVLIHRNNKIKEIILNDINKKQLLKVKRAPIVSIMGHVDHGKTSLLDYIRSSKINKYEIGGITQHIGAYYVKTKQGPITFLDTPGHAAFNNMRIRGINVADIIILVIAADDGIMPQTIEIIEYFKELNISIIIAINKIDKIDSNPEKIKKDLIKYGLIAKEWGGNTQFINISTKSGYGIDNLLREIILKSEFLELKAIKKCIATGIVIEASLDKKCGPLATILIKEGTLNIGDFVLCGAKYGKIKSLKDEFGNITKNAIPSMPVRILGLSGIPELGDTINVITDKKKAKNIALYRKNKIRKSILNSKNRNIVNNFSLKSMESYKNKINIILKTDVYGSMEAIINNLKKLSKLKPIINIIYSGIGEINETDVRYASISKAYLLGFNVTANFYAKRIINRDNLYYSSHKLIYNLIDEVNKIISSINSETNKFANIGIAEVKNIFKLSKYGLIIGCMVIKGIIKFNNKINIFRNKNLIYQGKLESLKRFKENVLEVQAGIECGIVIKKYDNIKCGDLIYSVENINN